MEGQVTRPVARLVGADSNIFNLLGIATRALRRAGQKDKEAELWTRVLSGGAHSFDEALGIILEYVEPE